MSLPTSIAGKAILSAFLFLLGINFAAFA